MIIWNERKQRKESLKSLKYRRKHMWRINILCFYWFITENWAHLNSLLYLYYLTTYFLLKNLSIKINFRFYGEISMSLFFVHDIFIFVILMATDIASNGTRSRRSARNCERNASVTRHQRRTSATLGRQIQEASTPPRQVLEFGLYGHSECLYKVKRKYRRKKTE